MSNLTLILFITGVALFIIYLIVILTKKISAFSLSMVGVLLMSLILVSGSLVNTLLEFNSENNVIKQDESSTEDKETSNIKKQEKPVNTQGEIADNTSEKQETELQKIARELVEQEMSKQEGLDQWEITENKVTSDEKIHNVSDYDKPEGNMRIVWIEGNVKATSEDDVTGNVGYDLELYQMQGEAKWRIGHHWGVLIDLEITEYP